MKKKNQKEPFQKIWLSAYQNRKGSFLKKKITENGNMLLLSYVSDHINTNSTYSEKLQSVKLKYGIPFRKNYF